jgi:hypothetical protein
MIAEDVYTIAAYLSQSEQVRLYKMLQENCILHRIKKLKKTPLITDEEAIAYLIKNVFSKRNLVTASSQNVP